MIDVRESVKEEARALQKLLDQSSDRIQKLATLLELLPPDTVRAQDSLIKSLKVFQRNLSSYTLAVVMIEALLSTEQELKVMNDAANGVKPTPGDGTI